MIDSTDVIMAFARGLALWMLTWGLNRVFLTFKRFLS